MPTSTDEDVCPKCGNEWIVKPEGAPVWKWYECDCPGAVQHWIEYAAERERERQREAEERERAEQEFARQREECPRCWTRGYVMASSGDARRCSCKYGKNWNREKAEDEETIPVRFLGAQLSDFDPKVQARCRAVDFEDDRGLLIHGPVGCGKTHLAVALMWEALEVIDYQDILFVSVPELLYEIRAGFDKGSDADRGILKRAMEVRVLILDDLGAERVTDWVGETLYMLINHRYNASAMTICTTNLAPSQIAKHIGDRAASRLMGMCDVVKLDGADRRLTKGA